MYKTNCREIHPSLYTAAKRVLKGEITVGFFLRFFLRNIILHYKWKLFLYDFQCIKIKQLWMLNGELNVFSVNRFNWYLVFYIGFCRPLIVPLSFFWPLGCLSFFDLWLLVTHLESSNFFLFTVTFSKKYFGRNILIFE
jgi:hypothetical protein